MPIEGRLAIQSEKPETRIAIASEPSVIVML